MVAAVGATGSPAVSGVSRHNPLMMTLAARRPLFAAWSITLVLGGAVSGAGAQAPSVYYVCPGNVFTNTISAKEAESRGCKAREAQQPTTIAGPKPRPVASPSGSRGATDKIDSSEQRTRDSDARRILEAELQRAEEQLDTLRREFNNGEPDRRGDERANMQRYLDRVAEMRTAIARQEADIAAIKREIAKLPT
jgi:hypothetical protein